ncbi:MAG: LacI family DNA-binding transcriptional regulator [Bacteroidota bacterium]
MKNRQVTIKDIAQQLAISPATVSRALKDHPDISKRTKEAVVELATSLNYQPNSIALSLRNKKTFTIGVIVPEIIHFFFSSAISGIEDVAYQAGYNVIICQSNESYEREVANINTLLSNRVDGILISVSKNTKDFKHLKKVTEMGVPLIFFDRVCNEINAHKVIVEDKKGAYEAVKHLIALGCKRIAHMAGPDTLSISKRRKEGYIKALTEHGIALDDSLIVLADNQEDGIKAMKRLLAIPNKPDAIFTVNDNVAVGAIKVIKKTGYKIPEDIAVIGFSDDQKITSLVEPHLSSIAQPAFKMGQVATELFLRQIEMPEKDDFDEVTLETTLVVRDSSTKSKIETT